MVVLIFEEVDRVLPSSRKFSDQVRASRSVVGRQMGGLVSLTVAKVSRPPESNIPLPLLIFFGHVIASMKPRIFWLSLVFARGKSFSIVGRIRSPHLLHGDGLPLRVIYSQLLYIADKP